MAKSKEESKALTNWEERMAAEAQTASAGERPSVSMISTRGGVMQYMGEPVPENKLKAVVLSSCVEHSYYPERFDPNNIVPPACFALGAPTAVMVPHENVPEPVKAACRTCPNFAWGSGSGRGKACSERRRLGLIPATALADSSLIPEAEVAMLKVPVTSVKNWAAYVNTVAGLTNRPPWGVLTEISLTPDPRSQFKVNFTMLDKVDEELLQALDGKRDGAMNTIMTPFDMTPPLAEGEPVQEKY